MKDIRRRYLVLFAFGMILIGTVFGAFVSQFLYPIEMSMTLVANYDIEIADMDTGDPITSLDWGTFAPDESKSSEQYSFAYVGNVNPAYIKWSVTNFPAGWEIQVLRGPYDPGQYPSSDWIEGSTLMVTPGITQCIAIVLTEVDGVSGQLETFTLTFESGDEVV